MKRNKICSELRVAGRRNPTPDGKCLFLAFSDIILRHASSPQSIGNDQQEDQQGFSQPYNHDENAMIHEVTVQQHEVDSARGYIRASRIIIHGYVHSLSSQLTVQQKKVRGVFAACISKDTLKANFSANFVLSSVHFQRQPLT